VEGRSVRAAQSPRGRETRDSSTRLLGRTASVRVRLEGEGTVSLEGSLVKSLEAGMEEG
jgi:hypothetical protein